jgi:glyoxylase-like metal-dependent hydrolase (beta-lactamase superfamily II)
MKARDLFLTILAACAACAAPDKAQPDRAGANFDRADGSVHIIRGTFAEDRSPDGNTVVLDTRTGLIVFDTGRHAAHVEQIIAYAKARDRPVVAIFNSHWHLDHVSGNPALRAAFPKAAVYSHDASLSEALAGFLARGAEGNRKRIAEGRLDEGQLEDAKRDLATFEARDRLHPTVSLEKPQALAIDGRALNVHVAKGASAGDIWLYDERAQLAIVGDLITLPAPFLDTACPSAWSTALNEVLAQPFMSVVPGHGRVMTRGGVAIYRDAFNALIACARGSAQAAVCADNWATGVAALQDGRETDGRAARDYARYYVETVLRGRRTRADCPA